MIARGTSSITNEKKRMFKFQVDWYISKHFIFYLRRMQILFRSKTIYLFFSTFSKVWGTPSVISGGTHAEVVVASQDEVI